MNKFLFSTLFFVAFSASANTFKCSELSKAKPANQKISVIVRELADLTNKVSFGKHYDRVYKVQVEVFVGSQKSKSFEAFATSVDVQYNINSVKKDGVSIFIYLDEADQAGIVFTSSNGAKSTIHLNCEWQ